MLLAGVQRPGQTDRAQRLPAGRLKVRTEEPHTFRQSLLNGGDVALPRSTRPPPRWRSLVVHPGTRCHILTLPFLSRRTYFDNIVAIDSLLEHIMVSVISARSFQVALEQK